MTVSETVAVVFVFILAAVSLFISILQFTERGFLFNNAYIYASEEERKTMDKKPYYIQSAIVFFILSPVFCVVGLSVVLHIKKLLLSEIPLLAVVVIYAIVSTVKMNKRDAENKNDR